MKNIIVLSLASLTLFNFNTIPNNMDHLVKNRELLEEKVSLSDELFLCPKIRENSKYIPGFNCLVIKDYPCSDWETSAYSNPFNGNIDIIIKPSEESQNKYIEYFFQTISNESKKEENKNGKEKTENKRNLGEFLIDPFTGKKYDQSPKIIMIHNQPLQNWKTYVIDKDGDNHPDFIEFYTPKEETDIIIKVFTEKRSEYQKGKKIEF